MPQPPHDGDTLFEALWPDLPPETVAMAHEFKAFTWVRKVKTPVQLLRLVLLYCGLDQSLREVAGHFTLLVKRITDSAVAERMAACRPWVRAGTPWRMMPDDLLPWEAVYQQTQRWLNASVFETIVQDLRVVLRLAQGRKGQPSAAIFASRPWQSTPESGPRAGYDGVWRGIPGGICWLWV